MTDPNRDERPSVAGRPISLVADAVRVLRFGAATHNTHRIHYDPVFAAHEGLAGAVVPVQLHGCVMLRAARAFARPDERVVAFGWRNRAPALVGDTLTARVTEAHDVGPGQRRVLLEERGSSGTLFAAGWAVLRGHVMGRDDVGGGPDPD